MLANQSRGWHGKQGDLNLVRLVVTVGEFTREVVVCEAHPHVSIPFGMAPKRNLLRRMRIWS